MPKQESHYQRGQMAIREQEQTFNLFLGMAKWGSLAAASLLLFFTLWFCTGAGFLAAAIAAVVVAAIGVAVLKAKPEAKTAH